MFRVTVKKQGEKIFQLEDEKNKLKEQLAKEKYQNERNKELLNYAKQIIEKGILGLYEIQEINAEGTTMENKKQRINIVINQLGKDFIKIKNELS